MRGKREEGRGVGMAGWKHSQQRRALWSEEPLVQVAQIIVGVSGGDVDGDIADSVCAVDDGDDAVGAEQASEGSDGQHHGGVGGYVADYAASDVEGGGVGLEKGSQGFDEGGIALQRPLRSRGEEGGWGGSLDGLN
jgi:hypothetical protein